MPEASDRDNPCSRLDLSTLLTLERPLHGLAAMASASRADAPDVTVSIVVCTRNRPESLDRCLQSIRTLSPAADEVIVVDNNPAAGATRAVAARFPEVTYLAEPRPGLSVARNSGVLQCRGAIIAFTDDDVVVDPGWIGAVRAAFSDRTVTAMTGLVLPAALATPAQYVFQTDTLGWKWGYQSVDFDAGFFASTRRVGVPAWRVGAGANMAFRREAFEQVGLFDERLGAGAAGCSEDSELWYRLLAEGRRCHYSPSAVVFHHHRSDWAGLREQLRSYMRGHVAALLFQFERYGHWGNVYRAFVALPWYLVKLAVRSAKQQVGQLIYDPVTNDRFAPVLPQILGAVAGYGYYLRHRSRTRSATLPQVEFARTGTP